MRPILAKHLVYHLFDLGQREHSGSKRVVGDGLIDQAWVTDDRGLDGHLFDWGNQALASSRQTPKFSFSVDGCRSG